MGGRDFDMKCEMFKFRLLSAVIINMMMSFITPADTCRQQMELDENNEMIDSECSPYNKQSIKIPIM